MHEKPIIISYINIFYISVPGEWSRTFGASPEFRHWYFFRLDMSFEYFFRWDIVTLDIFYSTVSDSFTYIFLPDLEK